MTMTNTSIFEDDIICCKEDSPPSSDVSEGSECESNKGSCKESTPKQHGETSLGSKANANANAILKSWLLSSQHFINPYPTKEEKKFLLAETGMTGMQLKNWFTNARRRTWKPIMKEILNDIDMEPILEKARLQWSAPHVKIIGDKMMLADGAEFKPKKNTMYLKSWILAQQNFLHPYPNQHDRQLLAKLTNLSSKQMKDWFTNARRRIWKPVMNKIVSMIDFSSILEAASAKNSLKMQSKEQFEDYLPIPPKQNIGDDTGQSKKLQICSRPSTESNGEETSADSHSSDIPSSCVDSSGTEPCPHPQSAYSFSHNQQKATEQMDTKTFGDLEAVLALKSLHRVSKTFSHRNVHAKSNSILPESAKFDACTLSTYPMPEFAYYPFSTHSNYNYSHPLFYIPYPPFLPSPYSSARINYPLSCISPFHNYPPLEVNEPYASTSPTLPETTQNSFKTEM